MSYRALGGGTFEEGIRVAICSPTHPAPVVSLIQFLVCSALIHGLTHTFLYHCSLTCATIRNKW